MRILVIGQAAFVPNISLCVLFCPSTRRAELKRVAERFILTWTHQCDGEGFSDETPSSWEVLVDKNQPAQLTH